MVHLHHGKVAGSRTTSLKLTVLVCVFVLNLQHIRQHVKVQGPT